MIEQRVSADYHEFIEDSLGNIAGLGGPNARIQQTKFHYKKLTEQERLNFYRESDLAEKLVAEIPTKSIRKWLKIESENDEKSQWIASELKRLNAKEVLLNACIGANYSGGNLILLGTNAGEVDYRQPLENQDILELSWLANINAKQVKKVVISTELGPEFNRPKAWQVALNEQDDPLEIHKSRVLVFQGGTLPPGLEQEANYLGDSLLDRRYAKIMHYEVSIASMAAALSKFHEAVLFLDGLQEQEAAGTLSSTRNVLSRIAKIASIYNYIVLPKGSEYKREALNVSGMPQVHEQLKEDVASALNMPQTILFRHNPGGLGNNGTLDLKQWAEQLESYQKRVLLPPLQRLVKLICAQRNGKIADPDFEFQIVFHPVSDVEEQEEHKAKKDANELKIQRAQALKTLSEALNTLQNMGVLTAEQGQEIIEGIVEFTKENRGIA